MFEHARREIVMSNLLEIREFIQKIAEAIAHSLEIESQVVDCNLIRVAGTVEDEFPSNGGVVKKIIETGQYYIVDHPVTDANCSECPRKEECKEKAFIHCPIFLDNEVIGVMGLICFNDVQRAKLIEKKDFLLSFIQSMCELISTKLKEHEIYKKEQEMYKKIEQHNTMLNQIINTVSDGYIIINKKNEITHINRQALKILGTIKEKVVSKVISEVIPDLEVKNILSEKEYTSYDEININNKLYGVFITAMKDDQVTVGAVINFKIIDKISNRIYSRAYQTREITFDDILGQSKKIIDAKELAAIVSKSNPNVLLLGESGTGKELFARAIHYASDRSRNPFIPVNCAAIPRELLESELFGYEGGAFTGANRSGKPGKFELANKGTIFLDEIGDMPFYLQAKILRVLQDKTIEKVGGIKQKDIDVRIIAATNKDLEKMVYEGRFREDLYYRLNVIPINIPPLREREGDIKLLIEYFLKEYSKAFGTPSKKISKKAMEVLNEYEWPGNVRELENIVQYLISISNSSNSNTIDVDILPTKLFSKKRSNVIEQCKDEITGIVPLEKIEKDAILNALKICGDSTEGKLKAAETLGISVTTLYRKLARYKK